jgi:hypothetical protein
MNGMQITLSVTPTHVYLMKKPRSLLNQSMSSEREDRKQSLPE